MKLHAENERVSKRFAQLEESLRNTDHNEQRYKVSVLLCVNNSMPNMPAEWTRAHCFIFVAFYSFKQEIQQQILKEFKSTMNNARHQEKKQR